MFGLADRHLISPPPRNQPRPTLPQHTHPPHLPHHPILQSPKPPPPPAYRYQTGSSKTDSQQGAQETTERRCSTTHPRANSPAALIRSLPQDQDPTGRSNPNSQSVPPQPQ